MRALACGLLGLTLAVGACARPMTPAEIPGPPGGGAGGVPASPQPGSPPAATAVVHDVAIRNFVYTPATVSIRVGDSVRWTNYDAAPHDAVPIEGTWKTPLLQQNESAIQTFDAPGVHPYYCTVHPAMRGTLEVR